MFRNHLKSAVLSLLFTVFLFSVPFQAKADGFSLHLLDVGQGLSVLVEADSHYLLYDGGGSAASSFVVSYLGRQGVQELDYITVSHYDEDHLSGIVGALHVYACDTILEPDYTAETDIYHSYLSAAQQNGADIVTPSCGDVYMLGNAEVQVVGPSGYDSPSENNRCISLRIVYGDISCLLCGDMESDGEEDLVASGLELSSNLYVVNHHGSASSSGFYFLNQVLPEYALISCGQGNSYGHPAAETLERLQAMGCSLYRTDRQGTIVAHSDGSSLWFDTEPCTDWSSGDSVSDRNSGDFGTDWSSGDSGGENAAAQGAENAASGITYVCNMNTRKFHYEYCDSVNRMKESNKKYTNESREALIAQGFDPCQNCNP